RQRRTVGTKSIRVAIAGLGNCASSLIQGVEYYRHVSPGTKVPGLMHVEFGDYHVGDIDFVAAFDVDGKKLGDRRAAAMTAMPNRTLKPRDAGPTGMEALRGPPLDGLGRY